MKRNSSRHSANNANQRSNSKWRQAHANYNKQGGIQPRRKTFAQTKMQTHSSLPQSRLQMFNNDKDDPSSIVTSLNFSNMKVKRDKSSFSNKKS